MPELVFCRHGATETNVAGRFLSTADPPLCAEGRDQCERAREFLAPLHLERCLVSPMRRCLETREIVAPNLPFEIEGSLREVDFGAWEGKTIEWLQSNAPELLEQRRLEPVRFRPPEGESIEDAAQRLRTLAQRLQRASATLVVGHRVTLGILERLVRDLPLDSRSVAPLEPGEVRIVRE
ncbi:MAG TPA: histidine phosphatase family protein [Candidatus Binatia bacterium]|nr:histidine phosphatase family protein [Candidatus Binatia bacterium]